MKPMKIEEALARLAKNRTDEDALTIARTEIADKAVIMLRPGSDDLDPGETRDALRHARTLRQQHAPGGITLEAWLSAARQDAEACPITGRPLYKGKVEVQRPDGLPPRLVDWSPVPAPLRLVAAYRAELGEAGPPDLAVVSLTASALPVEWERARRDWEDLQGLKRPTPDQRSLVERVRARLVYVPEPERRRPAEEPPFPAPLPLPAPHPWGPLDPYEAREGCVIDGRSGCPGQRGGACAEPGQMGRCGRVVPGAPAAAAVKVPAATSAPLVVILHAPEDAAAAQELRRAMAGQVRQERLRLWMPQDVRPGARPRAERAQQLGSARVVVHLLSADYVAAGEHEEALLQAPAARHLPVQWRTCAVYGALLRAQALPRSGAWIASLRERDGAWCEVSQEIAALLR